MDRDPPAGNDETLPDVHDADARPSGAPLARYQLDETIGRGGMGEVVAARDEQIGRRVAIKRMRAPGASPELISRFLREARIQGRLDHPAIVPVYELGTSEGEPYFVMKKLSGVTLAEVLAGGAAGATFTRQQLLRAFVDVCLAIEFAHAHGVLHRDLKPANIMLGSFGEVYVLDWGIARVVGDDHEELGDVLTIDDAAATAVGTLLGTPGYMSPEQVESAADLDARSDVYALGSILFELLAGKPLHVRGPAALEATLAGVDARPSLAAPDRDLPPELDAVCQRATARERSARFASARELGDAVQRFLDGDRDLALRRELARSELARAHEALARGRGSAERAEAIRAAARALALDPHAREPAELVGRLMIEPPTDTPPEVEAELERQERVALSGQARRGSIAMLCYVVFAPVLYAAGVHDMRFIGSMLVLSIGVATARWLLADRAPRTMMLISMFTNMIIIAAVARFTSPISIAPGVAMIAGSIFAVAPSVGPFWLIYGGFTAAVVLPWVVELVGLAPQTFAISGDAIMLHFDAARLDPAVTTGGMIAYVAALVGIGIAMARTNANGRNRSHRALQLQSWQLRQLVTSPPSP